ncbi:hypothetical protein ACJX0J_035751, partial [Zea mays]
MYANVKKSEGPRGWNTLLNALRKQDNTLKRYIFALDYLYHWVLWLLLIVPLFFFLSFSLRAVFIIDVYPALPDYTMNVFSGSPSILNFFDNFTKRQDAQLSIFNKRYIDCLVIVGDCNRCTHGTMWSNFPETLPIVMCLGLMVVNHAIVLYMETENPFKDKDFSLLREIGLDIKCVIEMIFFVGVAV